KTLPRDKPRLTLQQCDGLNRAGGNRPRSENFPEVALDFDRAGSVHRSRLSVLSRRMGAPDRRRHDLVRNVEVPDRGPTARGELLQQLRQIVQALNVLSV